MILEDVSSMSTNPSTVRNSPISAFDATIATFDRILPNKSPQPSLLHKFPTQVELDSYRIALIPSHVPDDGIPPASPQNESMRQLLLLPLTWADFLKQIRAEHAPPPEPAGTCDVVQFGEIQLDFVRFEALRSDRPVDMTAMEFKVLKFFTSNPNRVISRDELLNKVWGYYNYPTTRTVDNRIMRLRQKLEKDAANPIHFRTVHGAGYKFVP